MTITSSSSSPRMIVPLKPKPPLSHTTKTPHNKLFDKTPEPRLSTLNSLLSTHLRQNNPTATWSLFTQMHRHRSDLDAYTYTPVLSACNALSDILRGQQLHALLTKTTRSQSETIANTALINMYFTCNSLASAVQVFEEMTHTDVVTWSSMVSGLVNHNMARYAIAVFKQMREFSGFTLCSVVKACGRLKGLRQGKQVHGLVIVMGSDLLVLGTAIIDFYADCGLMDEAMKVFSSVNCRKDRAIYNALVSGCVKNGKYEECFSIMRGMEPNEIALTSGLSICSRYSELFIGKQIHCVAIRFGFVSDIQLENALLDMYAKCGKILTARLLFDRLNHKTVVSWTSIIDGYGSQGCGIEAHELFKKMEGSGISPNSVTFLAVLSACGHSGLVEEGRDCFVSMRKKYGIDPGPEHYACFIDMLGRAGLIEEVWDLFLDMGKRSIAATGPVLATLLNACKLNLDIEKGEFAAKSLIELEPDKPANLVSLSNFYAAIERWDHVEELRNVMNKKGSRKQAGSSWICG